MAEETNHNDAGEIAPSTVEKQAPSVSEEHSPSTDSDQATDIPSANAPDPSSANPDVNPNAAGEKPTAEAQLSEKSSQTAVEQPTVSAKDKADDKSAQAADKPAAKKAAAKAKGDEPAAKAAKKEKAPAVEDKPFAEFIQQHYLPALKKALENQEIQDLDLTFEKQKIPVRGYEQEPECWQVIGRWQGGWRQFNVIFIQENIQGQRAFTYAENKGRPSTIEPFLIDERKVTLDLMVFGVVQRLNAQKWLVRN
ncbi:MAG: DUF2996 domain-containing protein [Aphanothece sp. CMT-3BRIN-NPC111]|jgi:hypothetical protein|nr:DUF2996 domain-containing protein [Aphanothece sp. CMT-3BRIN-NPC111]